MRPKLSRLFAVHRDGMMRIAWARRRGEGTLPGMWLDGLVCQWVGGRGAISGRVPIIPLG